MSAEPPFYFTVYTCKDCGERTTDPVKHSLEKHHHSGFSFRKVPLEEEK